MNTNVIVISGNLTAEPDIRQTQDGTLTAHFTVAVNRSSEKADFLPCVAFGKTAENIRSYLTKGSGVIVKGSLHANRFSDAGGSRTFYEISAQSVEFIGGRKKEPEPVAPDLSDFDEVLDPFPFR
ncbi:MAG: single-stranded DNA-binding protein [Oscillospiraceae bacterium]|nr:single-stranded DNA-binding protein [Oscillospiraceae bacterium]